MNTKTSILLAASALIFVPVVANTACSSSDSSSSGGTGKTASAAVVTGAADSHCAGKTVTVDPSVCHAEPAEEDGGADGGAEPAGSDYGDTMYGGEADDDDCKYHIKWSAAAGASTGEYGEVNFTAVITSKADGKALAGAPVDIEALDSADKPPLNTDAKTTEPTPGTYLIPVRFAPTASGKWTVRFHIHDDCNDSEESPHGHAAFFVQIDVK